MILQFGDRRNFGHERKCLGEVAKLKLFMQSAIDLLPFAVHATTLDCRRCDLVSSAGRDRQQRHACLTKAMVVQLAQRAASSGDKVARTWQRV